MPKVTYTISDGEGGTDTATLDLAVTPVNDAPVGTPIGNETGLDAEEVVSIDVSGAFSDVDGDTLSYDISGLPAGLDYDPDTGVISGTIDNSASQGGSGGVYTVEVTASDGTLTATQSFTYTVKNPAPDAANDTNTTLEDVPLSVDAAAGLLANDSDPDGDDLTVTGFYVDGTTYAAGETATIPGVGELKIYATGAYDFTPAENFNGPVPKVTYTISDGEGGTDAATLDLAVTPVNDAPEIDTIAGAEVFEAGLGPRTGDRAGDEAIGSGEIADGDPDNDSDTSETTTGSITFTAEEGFASLLVDGVEVEVGETASGEGHLGLLTITSLDESAGVITYSYTLSDNADHSGGSVADLFEIAIVDRDGMSATGVLTVTVHDDAPQDFTAQPMLFSNEGSATGSGALNFYESIGADGGTAVFSGITDGETLLLTDGTAVTSGGAPVQLYGDGTDVLVGRVDNGDGTFTDVFRLTLHPNGSVEADDAYTFELFRALDDGSARSLTDVQFKGTNVDYRVLQDAMGADDDVLFSAAASYSPADGYGAVDTVNASSNQFGVGTGPILSNGEVFRMDFVNGGTGGTTYAYADHYDVNAYSFSVGPQQFQPGARLTIRVFDATDPGPVGPTSDRTELTNDTQDQVSKILVNGEALELSELSQGFAVEALELSELSQSMEGGTYVYTIDLAADDFIQVFTEDGFNRIELQNSTTFKVGIGSPGYQIEEAGDPLPFMDFGVTITDTDGDVAHGSISLSSQPAPDLVGTAAGEALVGGDTANAITGGGGADLLTGNAGADRFVYLDVSDTGTGVARDVITDFEVGIDRIDLSAIDADAGTLGDDAFTFVPGPGPVAPYSLSWYQSAGATIVQGDVDGDGSADFEIELTGAIPLQATDFIL